LLYCKHNKPQAEESFDMREGDEEELEGKKRKS
jgi:hypothetical protein